MKTFACIGLVAAVTAAALAQDRDLVWSSPTVPPREALDRLNLKLAWSSVVLTESQRDGVASMQLTGKQLLVQTRSGLVTALDAETGRIQWSSRVGRSYQRPLPLAYNRKSVFVVCGTRVFSLDRDNGAQQWELVLTEGISAPPVAGEYQVYISSSTSRLSAYLLPQVDQPPTGSASTEMADYLKDEEQASGYPPGTLAVEPILAWNSLTRGRLEWAPLSGPKAILSATPDGEVFSYEKFPTRTRKATELFRYRLADGPVLGQPGHYEEMAYIGSQDTNLYAVNIETGRTNWRFTAGTPIQGQPIALEKDVYVVAERLGLARVNRATGEPAWHLPRGGVMYPSNREADHFIAANPKFVYAGDASGRLLVLDRATGLRLSSYEGLRDFKIPLANHKNDRLYFGAHNGLVVCMHDRDYPAPYRHSRDDDRAIDPRVAEVEGKLAKPISESEKEQTSLTSMLKTLLEKHGNPKYLISINAFKEAGIADIESRQVGLPRVTSQPLGDVLRRILAQVDATYRVIDDTIVIYPLPKKKTTP
jgi:hypothetical protein